METLDAIATRRSVREFNNRPVEKDKIDKLLHAAMLAPSAANGQPWHFLVVDKRGLLDKIPTVHPYSKMCLKAPLAVLVCTDLSTEPREFWAQDLAAATQNLLLAVRDLGLGAVWVGVYPDEERVKQIQRLLQLPEQVVPLNIIPIGYSDVAQKKEDRFIESRIHFNSW